MPESLRGWIERIVIPKISKLMATVRELGGGVQAKHGLRDDETIE